MYDFKAIKSSYTTKGEPIPQHMQYATVLLTEYDIILL